MARIQYASEEDVTNAIVEQLSDRPQLNLYRMLPRLGEPVALGFLRLGRAFLKEGSLEPRLREITILRTGHLCGASYEVHQHRRVARSVGLAEEKIEAIGESEISDLFTNAERAVIEYTDEVVKNVKARNHTFDQVRQHLGERLAGELTLLIGFYCMVCRFLENLEIDIEDDGVIA